MKPKFLFALFLLIGLAACRQKPTPIAELTATPTLTTIPTSTITPPPPLPLTATTTEKPTATPTNTPTVTWTPTTIPTPEPVAVISVLSQVDELPVEAAVVEGMNESGAEIVPALSNENGQIPLINLPPNTYTITITADGYLPVTTTLTIAESPTYLTVLLQAGFLAVVTAESSNLRTGPSTAYPVVGNVRQNEQLAIIGRNDTGGWLVVLSEEGQLWISATAIADGQMAEQLAVVPAPPTPVPAPIIATVTLTPAPTTPPTTSSSPPSGATTIVGPNLLVNDWQSASVYVDGRPVILSQYQLIRDVTPGVTYRFEVWIRHWSSPTNENTSVSVNPDPLLSYICINTNGDTNPALPTSVCSGWVSSIDRWSYLQIDAVAITNQMAVIIYGPFSSNGVLKNWHNIIFLAEEAFGISPVIATPTPTPIPLPTRPAPLPFNNLTLRDNMITARVALEGLGGVLDRLASGSRETCTDYLQHHGQLVRTALFDGVPPEWQTIYNDYIFAVENGFSSNLAIFSTCAGGDGHVSGLNYGVARTGINDSLNRLVPAIEAANALIGP